MGKGVAAAVGLHVVCCGLLPLVLIAGVSLSPFAWAGAAIAAVVAVTAGAVFAIGRRRRARACCAPERSDAAAVARVERRVVTGVLSR